MDTEQNINYLMNNYNEMKNELAALKENYQNNNNNNEKTLKEIELEIDNIILKKQNEYLELQINRIINIDKNNSHLDFIKIGDWTIKADDNKLYFYNNDLKIAMLGSDYNRIEIYKNKNGEVPYFFYNINGQYGEHEG